jgi:hypothetical protein
MWASFVTIGLFYLSVTVREGRPSRNREQFTFPTKPSEKTIRKKASLNQSLATVPVNRLRMPFSTSNIDKHALPIGGGHGSCWVDIEIAPDETERSTEQDNDDVSGRDPKPTCWYKFSCVMGWILTAVLTTILVVLVQQLVQTRQRQTTLPVRNATDGNSNHSIYEILVTEAPLPFVVRINCGATSNYLDGNGREWIPDIAPGIPNVYSVSGDGDVIDMTHDDPQQHEPHMDSVGVEGVGLYVDERIFKTVGRYEINVPSIGWYHVDLFC